MAKHVYIHIPFCSYICAYCDFVKMVKIDKYFKRYLTQLAKEIEIRYKNEKIETIYIGGGTPSVLSSDEIISLGKTLSVLNKSHDLEFTFEANPDSLTTDKLHALKKIGVNRLSIGVQTFNQEALKSFKREHSNEEVFHLIKQAKSMGFSNINVDLIYGYEGQDKEDLEYNLKTFIDLDIEHISIYSLQLEDNSIFGKMGYHKLDDEQEADYYIAIQEYLTSNGYSHYEISNFSREGYQSKHNNCYWEMKDYYGFGLGAHSFINNQRTANTSSMEDYVSGNYLKETSTLTPQDVIEEYMFLGLRKREGVSKADFLLKFDKPIEFYYQDVIIKLLKKGLIEDNENILLTDTGLLLANDVFLAFLID